MWPACGVQGDRKGEAGAGGVGWEAGAQLPLSGRQVGALECI